MKRPAVRINAISFAHLIAALGEGMVTRAYLVERTGLHIVTVHDYVHALHRVGMVYIAAWDFDTRGHQVIPVYSLGSAQDAKQPRVPKNEIQTRYRAKKKALSDPRYFREVKND